MENESCILCDKAAVAGTRFCHNHAVDLLRNSTLLWAEDRTEWRRQIDAANKVCDEAKTSEKSG